MKLLALVISFATSVVFIFVPLVAQAAQVDCSVHDPEIQKLALEQFKLGVTEEFKKTYPNLRKVEFQQLRIELPKFSQSHKGSSTPEESSELLISGKMKILTADGRLITLVNETKIPDLSGECPDVPYWYSVKNKNLIGALTTVVSTELETDPATRQLESGKETCSIHLRSHLKEQTSGKRVFPIFIGNKIDSDHTFAPQPGPSSSPDQRIDR